MIRRPPRSTRTDTLCPDTTRFRSNRALEPGSLYLVDSGGQYPDGTTDITRTVAIGQPAEEMRDRFTRVLKGHIALAKIGRAHVCTPVTNAHLVCRLLLEKKQRIMSCSSCITLLSAYNTTQTT